MTAVRNFIMVTVGIGLAWLLWRVNAAIGDQALLMLLGLIIGMAVAALALFAFSVVASTRQPQPTQPAQPQAPQWQPPVIVLLGDSQRSAAARYAAPAGLFAQPAESSTREIGERGEWVDIDGGASWK